MYNSVSVEDRQIHMLPIRHNARSRRDRYIPFKNDHYYQFNSRILEELIGFFVDGVRPSDYVTKYCEEASKNKDAINHCTFGEYKGNYVVVLKDPPYMETCGLILTYDEYEKSKFNGFMSRWGNNKEELFFSVIYKILEDKRRIRLIKGLPVEGVLYGGYPDVDDLLMGGFITYINPAVSTALLESEAVAEVAAAISRGVTNEQLIYALPRDPEARFLAREFTDEELDRIRDLVPDLLAKTV